MEDMSRLDVTGKDEAKAETSPSQGDDGNSEKGRRGRKGLKGMQCMENVRPLRIVEGEA